MKGSHQYPNFEIFQVLWWKCAILFMSFSKPQVSLSSNFASLFSVMKDDSNQGTSQSGNLENFECSDQNSPNSCHFWNNKSAFLQILHHSSVSWDTTPLYFFSWNFIYFQWKEPIKVQIWWNSTWAVGSLKFCTLTGSFCPDHIVSAKKVQKSYHDTEDWCKV